MAEELSLINRPIVSTVTEFLGPASEDDSFTTELCMDINGAFSELAMAGCIPNIPFVEPTTTWRDAFSNKDVNPYMGYVLQYVPLHVKLLFDPPVGMTLQEMTKIKNELLWKIRIGFDTNL